MDKENNQNILKEKILESCHIEKTILNSFKQIDNEDKEKLCIDLHTDIWILEDDLVFFQTGFNTPVLFSCTSNYNTVECFEFLRQHVLSDVVLNYDSKYISNKQNPAVGDFMFVTVNDEVHFKITPEMCNTIIDFIDTKKLQQEQEIHELDEDREL